MTLFGRDIKKVACSLDPWSISRSILSSGSNAFRKDSHNGPPYCTETDPDPLTVTALYLYYMFFLSSDSFQVPDQNLDDLPLINE